MVNLLEAFGTGAVIGITIKGIDKFSSVFNKASQEIQAIPSVAATAGVAAVGALGFAMTKIGTSSFDAAADIEQVEIAFTTMLGSAEEADKMMKDIFEFAKSTPFEVNGLLTSTKQLLAYGSSQEDVLDELRVLGDVSSAIGMEKLPNLIRAFGQVRAKTVLSGEELRQFTETGIALIPELEKVTGYSAAEITDQTKDLGISFDEVKQALQNMTEDGGIAFNAMESQMDSARGKFSNISDAIFQMKLTMGNLLLPVVSDLADIFLNEVLPSVEPLIPIVGDFLKQAVIGFRDVVVPMIPKLIELSEEFFEQGNILLPKIIDMMIDLLPTFERLIDNIIEILPLLRGMSEILSAVGAIFQIMMIEPLNLALSLLRDFLDLLGIEGPQRRYSGTKKGDILEKVEPRQQKSISPEIISLDRVPSRGGNTIINIDRVQGLGASDIAEALEDELDRVIRI